MRKIGIVGGGVIGLSVACRLLELNPTDHVTIISGQTSLQTTSAVAAAYWAPYWIGAYDHSLAISTLRTLQSMVSEPTSQTRGMKLVEFREWLDEAGSIELAAVIDDVYWWRHLPGIEYEWNKLDQPVLLNAPGRGEFQFTSEVKFTSVVVRMPDYLVYLNERAQRSGRFDFVLRWLDDLEVLLPEYDVVVNCSGWGAKRLVTNDPETASMKLLAGHVVRVETSGMPFAISLHRGVFKDRPLYIVPRAGAVDDAICGGTAIEIKDDLDPRIPFNRNSKEECDEIYQWCSAFSTSIINGKRCENLVGLRPMRSSLRIEKDADHGSLFHCYGHGGSGLTLSWGSADRIVELIQDV